MNDQHSFLYSTYHWLVPLQFNIARVCLERWADNPMQRRRLAIRHEDPFGKTSEWSYGMLADVSNRLANGLRKMGVQKGDRVAVLMQDRPEAIAASMAILANGAVLVPLSPHLGIDGLVLRLRDAGVRTLYADASTAPELPQVLSQSPSVQQLVGLDFENDDTLSWRSLLARESSEFNPTITRADDPAILLYTAGTTGTPKGVLHAHRVLIGIPPAFVAAQNWYPQGEDLFWSPVQWTSAPGLLHGLLAPLYFGREIITTQLPPTGNQALELLARYAITNALFLPADLARMHEAAAQPPRHKLRAMMVAGDTLPTALSEWAAQYFGLVPNEVYGLTEAPGILGNSVEKWPVRAGSMGRPIPGHRLCLVDSEGRESRRGSVGQLALHTNDIHGYPDPSLFLSYWGNETLTRARYSNDLFLTSDMASQDEDGYYWFIGRSDDVFRAGNYRISPIDIEDCMKQHPAVANAAVVPKPEGMHGSAIKAFVIVDSEARAGADWQKTLQHELKQHVRKRLAAWQMPQEIEFVDRLPLTPDGQLRRHVLRAREQQRSMLAAAKRKA